MVQTEQPIHCVVEANHIHRAGQKYNRKIFLVDVVGVISDEVISQPIKDVTVLYGTVQGAEKEQVFISAMLKHEYNTTLIPYRDNPDGTFTFDTEGVLDTTLAEIPIGSRVVLIGFLARKYASVLAKYKDRLTILLAAFTTVNSIGAKQYIVPESRDNVKTTVYLDNYAQSVFMYHRNQRSHKGGVRF